MCKRLGPVRVRRSKYSLLLLLKSLKKITINGPFNHKTFNADHVRLTSSKHMISLTSEGEFYRDCGRKAAFAELDWED